MKKYLFILPITCMLLLLQGCVGNFKKEPTRTPQISANHGQDENQDIEASAPTQDSEDISLPDELPIKVRLTFEGGEAIVSLHDNASARDFASKLPLTQTFEDFNQIEKICRLPDMIVTEGVEKGVNPKIADVTLYTPWNTLVFHYDDYGYNDDLISIGHVDSGMELLADMGDSFTVTMEVISENQEDKLGNQANEQTTIIMEAGDNTITAVLDNSETTQEFLAALPQTITMNHYDEREYYGRITTLSENGEIIPDFENGDVTYYLSGPSFAVFFDGEERSSLQGLVRMGKITSDLAVFNSMADSIEMIISVFEE